LRLDGTSEQNASIYSIDAATAVLRLIGTAGT
jgi:hypothetical protein